LVIPGWSDRVPDRLRRDAEVTGGGELLWPAPAAVEVVGVLVREELGVVGGELFVPVGSAKAVLCWEWLTDPQWRESEAWGEFVARGAEQARAVLEAGPPRSLGIRAGTELYFLAACARDEYDRQVVRSG
jgi:hypothetical protein